MNIHAKYFNGLEDSKFKTTPWNHGPVYIAGCDQVKGMIMRSILHNWGIPVLSSWLDADNFRQSKTDEQRQVIGNACFREIDGCDVLILLSPDDRLVVGGLYVEAGYALGLDKGVVVFGQPKNTMLYSERFLHAENDTQLYDVLGSINYYA